MPWFYLLSSCFQLPGIIGPRATSIISRARRAPRLKSFKRDGSKNSRTSTGGGHFWKNSRVSCPSFPSVMLLRQSMPASVLSPIQGRMHRIFLLSSVASAFLHLFSPSTAWKSKILKQREASVGFASSPFQTRCKVLRVSFPGRLKRHLESARFRVSWPKPPYPCSWSGKSLQIRRFFMRSFQASQKACLDWGPVGRTAWRVLN